VGSKDLSLGEAMIAAAEAPPTVRIEFRDAIARHGDPGVHAVEPWLDDPEMRRFAVRVIVRAAELGVAPEAKSILRRALGRPIDATANDEIAWGLAAVGGPPGVARPTRKSRSNAQPRLSPAEPLVIGRMYKRASMHDAGWGGNRQSGISYPANGDHALLFSDPAAASVHGYRDRWDGPDRYDYFGAWSGTGDMTLSGANRVVLDRSPNLQLLIKSGENWRYEGQFMCTGHEPRRTTRDGQEFAAIVFWLQRFVA
jgi:hypothetical protein